MKYEDTIKKLLKIAGFRECYACGVITTRIWSLTWVKLKHRSSSDVDKKTVWFCRDKHWAWIQLLVAQHISKDAKMWGFVMSDGMRPVDEDYLEEWAERL